MVRGKFNIAAALLGLGFAGIVAASPAAAATAYASKSGSDSNTCASPLTPCLTLNAALSQAIAGGGFDRIVILGPGIFNESLSVTSSIEIIGDGSHFQAIYPGAGNTAITVDSGGAGDFRLSNIQLLGTMGDVGGASTGFSILSANFVNIDNVEMHGFGTNAISFTPTNQYPTLTILNSVIGDGYGFAIHPTTAQYPNVQINNTTFRNCWSYCVRADASAMTSGQFLAVNITNSLLYDAFTNNVTAVSTASSGFAGVKLDGSTANYAGQAGVNANGQNTVISLNKSAIVDNATGVNILNGGKVASFGNNDISGNITDLSGGSLTAAALK